MVRQQHGFTLLEVVFTLIVAVMLIGGVFLVYLMSIRSWEEGARNASLERTAGIIVEKIVRGVNGRFGLREADVGTLQVSADGHSVNFLVDKHDPPTSWTSDDTTSRFYQVGTRLWYDPNTAVASDEIPLNRFGDVQSLDFSLSGYVLKIKLALTAAAPRTTSRRLSVRMETDVYFRKRR